MKWFQAFYLLLNSNRRIGLTSYHVCPLTIYMLLLIFHITHATYLKTLNNKQYLKNEYFSTDAKVSTITYSHFIVPTTDPDLSQMTTVKLFWFLTRGDSYKVVICNF